MDKPALYATCTPVAKDTIPRQQILYSGEGVFRYRTLFLKISTARIVLNLTIEDTPGRKWHVRMILIKLCP